jgi:hypothetical protein
MLRPYNTLPLPTIRSEVTFADLPEEGGSNGHFLQDNRRFHAHETKQFVDSRDLDVVQHT